MYQREMRTIQDVVEVMIVIVYLRGGELSLVDDVLGREGAYVEALGKRTLDRGKSGRLS